MRVVSQMTDASQRRYHTLWAMNQLCRALADSPEREPHARAAFGRGWQSADVSFLQGLSRAAMMVVSSSVGALLIHVRVPPDSDRRRTELHAITHQSSSCNPSRAPPRLTIESNTSSDTPPGVAFRSSQAA